MTMPDDDTELRQTESLLTASLDRHAAEAPADDALLSRVHHRLRRRRNGRTVGGVVLACAAVAVAITAGQSLSSEVTPAKPPTASSGPTGSFQAQVGWRWESYKTIQVQVPPNWTNFISGDAPCGSSWKKGSSPTSVPAVGRFGPWLDRRCGVAVLPLAERQEYLWFDDVQKPGVKQYDGGWTEETRDVGGVHVSVLTKDDTLRRRILDSAAPFTGPDAYGCAQDGYSSLKNAELDQPKPSPGSVTSIDTCEYWKTRTTEEQILLAGSRLQGEQATALAKRLFTELPSAREVHESLLCLPPGSRSFRLTIHSPEGSWTGLFDQLKCTQDLAWRDGAKLRGLSRAATDLLRTGVHHPVQPSDIIDVPGTYTPPER